MDRKKLILILVVVVAAIIVAALLLRDAGAEAETPAGAERTSDGALILTPVLQEDEGPVPTARTTTPEKAGEKKKPSAAVTGGGAAVPERERSATSAYFADAAFVGNETVAALGRYDYDGLLSEAAFYEVETVSDNSYTDQLIKDGPYAKVYIGLGGAEMANRADTLRDSLTEAIAALKEDDPDVVVILMSVTPVSKYRTDVSKAIRMERATEYNTMLVDLAAGKNVWYLEITSALVNEEGFLPSEVTEDGVNFTPAHYAGWYDVLAAHYIGDWK